MIPQNNITATEPERSPQAGIWRKVHARLSSVLTFPVMLLTTLLVSPFTASLDVQQGGGVMRDPDIWWHLRNAQLLFATHHFVRWDHYSSTALGQPWIDFEWLSEVPYYAAFKLFGERGLFLMMLVTIELIIVGIAWLCYRRTREVKSAYLATWIAVLFASISIGLRTLLFGWVCFIAEMVLLLDFRKGRDHIWLLVPLFCLWINLHASWLIGLVFFLAFIASGFVEGSWGCIEAARWSRPEVRKLIGVCVLSLAAVFVNPYGWRLVAYPFDIVSRPGLLGFQPEEWQTVDFQTFHGVLFFFVVTLMFLFTLARRRSWQLHDVLFALLAVFAALQHRRFLFLVGIVVCPMLAEEFSGVVFSPYDRSRNKPLLNAVFIAAFLGYALFHIPTSSKLRAAEANYFPTGALHELNRCCADGHLFNHYEWGGYLIWNSPNVPVFIDTRGDLFAHHHVYADYLEAISLHDSLEILDRDHVESALLPAQSPLAYLLRHTAGWRVQYEGGPAVLFVRDLHHP